MVDRSRWQLFAVATRTASGLGKLASVLVVSLMFALIGLGQARAASPIHIASPAPDAVVSNLVTTSVKVKPGVASIAFKLDGTVMSSSSSTRYVWDSTMVPNGAHTISATAYSSSNQPIRTVSEVVRVSNHKHTATPTATATPGPAGILLLIAGASILMDVHRLRRHRSTAVRDGVHIRIERLQGEGERNNARVND